MSLSLSILTRLTYVLRCCASLYHAITYKNKNDFTLKKQKTKTKAYYSAYSVDLKVVMGGNTELCTPRQQIFVTEEKGLIWLATNFTQNTKNDNIKKKRKSISWGEQFLMCEINILLLALA